MTAGSIETAPPFAVRPSFFPFPAATAPGTQRPTLTADVGAASTGKDSTYDDSTCAETAYERNPAGLFDIAGLFAREVDDGEPVGVHAILTTKALLQQAAASSRPFEWLQPHVTKSPQGEIVLEWWGRSRKLTVYVSEQSRDYVKVWGKNMDTEMADGELPGGGELAALLRWLRSEMT